MDEFFQEGNVYVVVGATNDLDKYGGKVFKDLLSAGYGVIAVNNRIGGVEDIQGTPSYASLDDFFDRVIELFNHERKQMTLEKTVLVMVIPPENALPIVQNAIEHDITKIWFQPGAESEEALAYCTENGVSVIHSQCIMVRRPK